MKIECIDRNTPFDVLSSFFNRIRIFLADLEDCYPFFTNWLNKVFTELKESDNRKILLCLDENVNILGIAILKNDTKEKKICTLRVHKEYQRKGIGTALLKRSIEELNDSSPLITVSERQIDDFSIFLSKNGFKLKDKVKSIYRKGEYEYFYNKEYKHTAVI